MICYYTTKRGNLTFKTTRELRDKRLKFCPRCKKVKGYDEYYPNAANSSGIQSTCKECCKETSKKRSIK